MSRYWVRGQMDTIRVNVEIDGQQELTHRKFFITQDSETGYDADVPFKL